MCVCFRQDLYVKLSYLGLPLLKYHDQLGEDLWSKEFVYLYFHITILKGKQDRTQVR